MPPANAGIRLRFAPLSASASSEMMVQEITVGTDHSKRKSEATVEISYIFGQSERQFTTENSTVTPWQPG